MAPTEQPEIDALRSALAAAEHELDKERSFATTVDYAADEWKDRAQASEARAIAAEEALKLAQERGARAVIAYHTAICCPKGVVPVDDLYDPVMAASISANMDDYRTALAQKEGG